MLCHENASRIKNRLRTIIQSESAKKNDRGYKTNITSAHEWEQMTVTASSRRQNDASKTSWLCNHSWSLVIGFRLYPGQRVRLTVSRRTFSGFFLRSRLQNDGKIMQIRKVNEEGHRSLDSSHATELRRRKRHRGLHRWLHQWLHDNNLAVGRTYVSSTFKNKLLLGPEVKLSLFILPSSCG